MARLQLFFGAAAMKQLRSMDGLLKEVGLSKSRFYVIGASTNALRLSTLHRHGAESKIDDLRRGPPAKRSSGASKRLLGLQPSSNKTCFLQGLRDQNLADRINRFACAFGAGWNYSKSLPRRDRSGPEAGESSPRCRCAVILLSVAKSTGCRLGCRNIEEDARKKTLALAR